MMLATAFGVAIYLWLNLRATRTRMTGLERVQIVVDTQLALAAEIQRRLLPSASAGSNGVRWAGRLEPALRIGGDFYDFIQVNDDDLFVVVDVSGKGIPASLLQASAHRFFTARSRAVNPADLLTRISRGFKKRRFVVADLRGDARDAAHRRSLAVNQDTRQV
jgi:sigma-B regulation protein RsbU (phosphoserine phosphatase)